MQATEIEKDERKPADLKLAITRLEEEALRGGPPERLRLLLASESAWRGSLPADRLKLGRLAQMAGEVTAARKVLESVTRDAPELEQAWQELIDLLMILGERGELAQALAAARPFIGEADYRRRVAETGEGDGPLADAGTAATPFEEMRGREQALTRYLRLFSGREDCFARQWANRAEGKSGYVPERRAFSAVELEEHLAGRKTYGFYLLRSDGRVATGVLDADLALKFRQGKLSADDKRHILRERQYLFGRIKETSLQAGARPLIEFSGGKGFHFWFFFEPAIEAALVRRFLERLRSSVAGDLSAFNLEVFPKQDALSGKGLGNLVKLPLGVHRLTGKRSHFVECADRATPAQLSFLAGFGALSAERAMAFAVPPTAAAVIVHPRMKKWAEDFPEFHTLEKCCPPLGQIISACRSGSGLSMREEKIIFHTLGFLPRAKTLVHRLFSENAEYNPHLVDFKLSRLRGKPLGCHRIHSLLNFAGDFCRFERSFEYPQPLLHLEVGEEMQTCKAEKVENLTGAIENLKLAIIQVERFLK